ncbi:hypothetical protein Mbo2_078 [Rhodococcus phage Mbo2]|uniref:Uncharacterized protein n=1 Tax=Rhodococcus phage Mbo2 TaxID=2936911 RepID=A0A9E7IGN4_9CAUD|nr:hypothetical protein Mbo2_078 [Rhodococcus phage Mbo2]
MSWRTAAIDTSTAQSLQGEIEWGDISNMPRVHHGDMIRFRPTGERWETWIPIQGNILRIRVAPPEKEG